MQILSAQPTHWLVRMDRLREVLTQSLSTMYPVKVAGIIQAMLLGEQQGIQPDLQEMYSQLGLIHVLCISGLHVTLICAFLFFLLKHMGMTRESAACCMILFLPFYVILTGAGVPVIRAAIMAGLGFIAIILGRWKETLSFLAVAFLVQMGINPYAIYSPGFQLSFLITAGLIWMAGPLAERLPTPWKRFNQGLAVTLIAQVVSFPILISHFYEFSILSWLVNLLLVPVYSVIIIPLSMMSLCLFWFLPSFAHVIAKTNTWVIDWVHSLLRLTLEVDWAHLIIPPPSPLWTVMYIGTVVFLSLLLLSTQPQKQRYIPWLVALYLFLFVFAVYGNEPWRGEHEVIFIDVGQGDAILVKTKGGKNILIDTGGTLKFHKERWQEKRDPFEVGKDVLYPFLAYQGVKRIDTLIVTHGDMDHIGGSFAIIDRIPVKEVVFRPNPGALPQRLFEQLKQKQIPIYPLTAGVYNKIEKNLYLFLLHPHSEQAIDPKSANANSLVFYLFIEQNTFLFTGDIGIEEEQDLLDHWALTEVDFLKVAHHGSDTSTGDAWLQTLKPKHAVISAGKGNRFGHPSKKVLQRLQELEAVIWRTDEMGAISVRIDTDGYQIQTMKEGGNNQS